MKGGSWWWWWWWALILNLLASRCSFNGFSSVVLLLFFFLFHLSGCVVTAGGEHRGKGGGGWEKLEALSFVEQPKKLKREKKTEEPVYSRNFSHFDLCKHSLVITETSKSHNHSALTNNTIMTNTVSFSFFPEIFNKHIHRQARDVFQESYSVDVQALCLRVLKRNL